MACCGILSLCRLASRDDRTASSTISLTEQSGRGFLRRACFSAKERAIDEKASPTIMQPADPNQSGFSENPLAPAETHVQVMRLMDEDWHVRLSAAEALGTRGGAATVEPLCAALRDQDPSVRAAAARALGQIRDSRAVEPLCIAFNEKDWDVRAAAVNALWHIRDVRAVGPFCAALMDEHKTMRLCAIETLGHLGDSRAVVPLCAPLKEENDPAVRSAAAEALGQIGDARAVEPLCAALKDNDWDVRVSAAAALAKLGDNAELPLRILSSTMLTPAQRLNTFADASRCFAQDRGEGGALYGG